MSQPTDMRVVGVRLYLLPVRTRVPLKFGPETLTEVTCLRVALTVVDRGGGRATGWGETPLSVQWGWPSALAYGPRHRAMVDLARAIGRAWMEPVEPGHPLELGWDFVEDRLPGLHRGVPVWEGGEPMPWLAALITASPFDLALHDAFGRLTGRPVYETYHRDYLNRDLASFLEDAGGDTGKFAGRYPDEFLVPRRNRLRAWHLVGGLDPLVREDLRGDEPEDGYPVLLSDWIRRDGLTCLKIKLRGNDLEWDYGRLRAVGRLAEETSVDWLSADFNCTVSDVGYVNTILDRLRDDEPRTYGRILYVEQPFAHELEAAPTDVRSVSARKPLFMDESAHDWRVVRRGQELGWTGVALKTCKTQSGALLSSCWAQVHGMGLMVQDLTNPMLAQVPHLLLAAHVPTIMGVETNSMQFYPEASKAEASRHPGCYSRRGGTVDIGTLEGPGFGWNGAELARPLPEPDVELGDN